ncbi:MAG: hypothetical protein KIS96_14500 [Bauldia sp.]|nr:hypothetical protein [Bauldia sp.]
MALRDCLISAAEQGEISRQEAAELADAADRAYMRHRATMSDDAARARARAELEAELRATAIEKKRRADLTEAARLRVKGELQGFRDRDGKPNVFDAAMGLLSHYGFRTGSSVRGRAEAIVATAHAKLSEVMFSFERKGVLGRRANRALTSDVLKELHGEASGDATAKALARSVSAVFEDLRQRFNAAGGAIGKLENFGLSHSHDRMKLRRLGRTADQRRDAWKAVIRPLLDPERMVNPLTGQPVGSAGLDQALDHVFDSIISENRAHLQPQARTIGRGAIASQRQDERFLVFKDAASWEAYHRKLGRGDPVQAIFNHVNGMARDIAAMEILGPNPAAMVEYMKQVTALEIGKSEAGYASLAKEAKLLKASAADWAQYRISALWQTLRGRPDVVSGVSSSTADVKNLLTSAQLGSTAMLAAATDPFIAAASRKLAGLPVTSTVRDMIGMLSTARRREIIRSGIVWDEYLHVMTDELRFAGPAVGGEWSRWLADRAVTWSGLKPLTTGRKLVEARFWQGHIADRREVAFAALDPRFRRALEGFGVRAEHWDIWRTSVDAAGFVTPAEIERRGGPVTYIDRRTASPRAASVEAKAQRHRAAAEKLAEVISSWSERSVPSGTPNARSVVTGKVERGTVGGELLDYALQYKSFGLSFTAMQMEAIGEMAGARGGGRGWRTGLGYFAPMAIMLTLGGAAYLQIKALIDGRQPEDMREPQFWLKAGVQGGGFGLFGDFVKSTENRFGQSMLEALMGPGVAFLSDAGQLTVGNALEAAGGDDTQAGRELTRFARRYTPVASSHWAMRGAYNRLVLDNLQWMLDPAADKSFKAQAAQAKKNGTPYLVPPGAFTP